MMVSSIPFTLCFGLWFVHGTFIEAFSFSKPTAYRSAHPKITVDYRSRHSVKQQSTSCKSSSTGSTSDTESSNTSITPKSISSAVTYSHHIAIKTRNIQKDFACRAVDLTKHKELLGLNHFGLNVTHNIPRSVDASSPPGIACELSARGLFNMSLCVK
jgi:hypothetical protein